jgi:hypothetical protein
MKRFIFIFGVIGAGLCSHAADAAPAECFATSHAVFTAHPNASHASYTLRVKRSERCWFADAFRSETKSGAETKAGGEAKAAAKPAPRGVATVARTSTPHPAITAQAPQAHTTALAPAPWPRAMAMADAPAPRPRTAAVAPAVPSAMLQFPREIPPAIEIAINARELSRLLPADETPADFESRFSVSGWKVRR